MSGKERTSFGMRRLKSDTLWSSLLICRKTNEPPTAQRLELGMQTKFALTKEKGRIKVMIKRGTLIALATIGILTWGSSLYADPNNTVAYPSGYRKWAHVKSALVGPASPSFARYGGLHHIYANEKAMEGYRTGQFEDGSVIVFDLLEVRESAGVTAEGSRRFIDVIAKDSKRFAQTGGWGFEEFKGDSQSERVLTSEAQTACFNCHLQKKDRGFVFSAFRQ